MLCKPSPELNLLYEHLAANSNCLTVSDKEIHSKKRKKYLEPDASAEDKLIPRTSLWRGNKCDSTSNQNEVRTQIQTQDEFIERRQDAAAARDPELFEVNNEDNIYNKDLDDEPHHFEIYEDEDHTSLGDLSSISDGEEDNRENLLHEDVESNYSENIFKSNNLADNLKIFNLPLFENASTTTAETMLMVMSYAIKHKLTWTAVEDLLKMINTIFGESVLPQTKYSFRKIFGNTDSMRFHFYCTECNEYLQKYDGHLTKKFDKTHSQVTCPNPKCNKIHDTNTLKESSFFATLSLKSQISALLDLDLVREALKTSLNKINEKLFDVQGSISDLTEGELYKDKRRELFKDNDISLTMNTDGSPVFKSSRSSMWLIQAVINELPPKLRWEHGIIGGLWFGKGHPNMKLFMETYVKELSELCIQWKDGDQTIESNVFTLCGCFDSPARCAVQNMSQFNGYFGCPWCLHPGVLIDNVVKYVTLEEDPELRTEKDTLKVMGEVLKEKSSTNGVKGPSPMILAQGLDFIRGICPEYMHAVLLGVTRQITEIYLTSVGEEFYIGSPTHLRRIDRRLLHIKPPHIFTRLPRSIMDRKFWKAHEWKAWLLYYAIPCLRGVLPDKYIQHLTLFSNSVFLLLQDTIFPDDISSAENMLMQFVIETEILFGPAAMTFNVHQMLHLASSVRDLGPLWAHSAFVFESGNGRMLKLVSAAKGVPLQILNRFCMEKKLEHFFNQGHHSEKVTSFYNSLHSNDLLKNCCSLSTGIHLLGKEKILRTFDESEKKAFVAAVGTIPQVVSEYNRIIMNSCMYHSEVYTRAGKTDNTVVKISARDGVSEFVKIQKFFAFSINSNRRCYMLCRELLTPVQIEESNCLPNHIKELSLVPKELSILMPVEEIKFICAFVEIDSTQYVCHVPNFHEKD